MIQIRFSSRRSVYLHRCAWFICAHCAKKAWKAKHMIAMPVADQNLGNSCWLDAGNTHLPLRALSAIHKDTFFVVRKENSGMVSYFCRLHAPGSQKRDFNHRIPSISLRLLILG